MSIGVHIGHKNVQLESEHINYEVQYGHYFVLKNNYLHFAIICKYF